MNKSKCPICLQELQEGDTLYAKWFEPKQWFVLIHERDGNPYCGRANQYVVEEATERMRNLAAKETEECTA